MQIIYSYLEPWVIQQNVYLISGDEEAQLLDKISLENLPEYLAYTYTQNNCNKIILHGSSYNYTTAFAEDVKNVFINNYGLNDINIEVIKE